MHFLIYIDTVFQSNKENININCPMDCNIAKLCFALSARIVTFYLNN